MTNHDEKAISKALEILKDHENPIVAALADALVGAASHPFPERDEPCNLEVKQLISNLTGQLSLSRHGAATVLGALVEIDSKISEEASCIPWATRLTPLACECAINAEKEIQSEKTLIDLQERAPIFRLDDRTVIVVPVGKLELENLSRISDRIDMELRARRTKRVVLVLNGLETTTSMSEYLANLSDDLKSQKVRLEIIDEN